MLVKACRVGVCLLVMAAASVVLAGCSREPEDEHAYVGSRSCRECHERFYKLWEPSHHGKAMQPYTDGFAKAELTAQSNAIAIGEVQFKAVLSPGDGYVLETGPDGTRKYDIKHAMGGKNVYFFLTEMERGRLQVLPISYDVDSGEWFDTTASMVRHLGVTEDEALHWTDPMLTFNTSCFNCHVSQLRKNYDLATDTYQTVWREPGISCETCHGPSSEHNRVCREAKGAVPADLKVLSWKALSPEQRNDACNVCHAKAAPITPAFNPGDRFFDHFDLTCFEDRDFYPDGRDLGENYTMTGWMMNPCAKQGKLDCIHCHTSSGRYRFQKENVNGACLPCHNERVADIAAHSHHAVEKEGAPTCVSCHMPLTTFGRMDRSDHSFRPPSGEATLQFKSPNACNLCHKDKDAEWVADTIKKWHPDGKWTGRLVREGQLVQWARAENGEHLPDILEYVQADTADDIVVVSLLRLLAPCRDARVAPVLRKMLGHAAPLVRSAAATSLGCRDMESARALLPLLSDEYRLVRIRAANALLVYPRHAMTAEQRTQFEAAEQELLASMRARPDQWSSHYNLGLYWGQLGQASKSLESYKLAIRMRPDVLMPYVNASIMASRLGDSDAALRYLLKAYELAPTHSAVNMNLGLLFAERNNLVKANMHLRLALVDKNTMPQAAYNLAVLVGGEDPSEAVDLCERAVNAAPGNRQYQQALEYYKRKAAK